MKILFVSIAFPPKGDPESLQVLKYYRRLLEYDTSITVVTSANPTLFMEPDEKLRKFLSGYHQLIEVPIRESRTGNFLRRKLNKNSLSFPDSKHKFFQSPDQVCAQITEHPDVIYSRSYPLSSSVLAFELANRFNCPWIMHLSDPWSFEKAAENGNNVEEWSLEWERKCIFKASYVTLTSKKTVELYKNKYPEFRHKFLFYPNVYDRESLHSRYLTPIGEKFDKIKLLYTGGLTAVRTPETLIESLRQLKKSQPNVYSKLNVELVGPKDRFVQKMIDSSRLEVIANLPQVGYNDSLKLQKESDVLLILDAPTDDVSRAVYFPSKILDYMTAFKPILAITPKGSTTYNVINDYELGGAFDHSQVEEIVSYIVKCTQEEYLNSYIERELPEEFDAAYNVSRLFKLFSKTIEHENN